MKNKKSALSNLPVFATDFFLLHKKLFWAILLAVILLLGTAFRCYHLGQIPAGLHSEEAQNGLLALNLADENITSPPIKTFQNLLLLSFKLLGVDIFALRFISALVGTLTLLGFYLLLKELRFTRPLLLLGTFLISFSFWHIHFSRLAYPEIFIPFFIIWFSFLLVRGIFSHNHFYFVLAGTLLGLGNWIHPLMFFLWLIPALFILQLILLNRQLLKYFKLHLLLLLISALTFAATLLIQVGQSHSVFWKGFTQTLNFSSTNLSPIKNFFSYFGSLFYLGDPNQLHNHLAFSLIPLAWSILFLFGIFLAARSFLFSLRKRSSKKTLSPELYAATLAQSILAVALLIGALNASPVPNSRQFIWAIPAVFIFCIIPFEYLLQIYQKLKQSTRISLKRWRWRVLQISLFGLVLAIILAGFSQIYLYFKVWAKNGGTKQVFQQEQLAFGKLIKNLPRKEFNFIVVPKNIALETVKFSGFPTARHYRFITPQESLQVPCKNSLLVFYQAESALRKQLQEKCPNNTFRKFSSFAGNKTFWTMQQ